MNPVELEDQPRVAHDEDHVTPIASAHAGSATHLQECEQCGSRLDDVQRYCLNCGARHKYVDNPALKFLGTRKRAATKTQPDGPRRTGITLTPVTGLLAGLFLLVALGIGALIGGNGGQDNTELVAALKNQKAPVINVNGGGTDSLAEAAPIASDFSLDKGFAVQLSTLPTTGTDQAAVDKAKADATGQGAADVGVINQTDYTVTPDPGAENLVIYSGEFKKKGDAQKALKKLKKSFPSAAVISVKGTASDSTGGKAIATTKYGTAHSAQNFKPTEQKVKKDKKIVKELKESKGQDYLDKQKEIPSETVIPEAGGGTPQAPSGPGE